MTENLTNATIPLMSIKDSVASNLHLNELLTNGALAILILIIGAVLGKIVSYGLKKLSKKIEIQKHIRGSFVDLIIVVIRWSIYLIFLNLALRELEIPVLTNLFGNVLIAIPAFIASLVILTIGFAIAVYLRGIIEDAEITGWDLVSKIFFYFVLFIFGVYAVKVALIPLGTQISNYVIIGLTIILPISIAILIGKRKPQN